jgi:hypothetical protein
VVRHCLATRWGGEDGCERVRPLWPARGCRRRRRRHRHLQRTPAEHAACRTALEARLGEWPEAWALVVVAEATVRRHPPRTAQWCVRDDVPEGPTGDLHTQGPGDGAVVPWSGRTHAHLRPAWGPAACAQVWRPLRAYHPGKRRLIIPDRGAQHNGAAVEEVVREARGRLMLKAQPA